MPAGPCPDRFVLVGRTTASKNQRTSLGAFRRMRRKCSICVVPPKGVVRAGEDGVRESAVYAAVAVREGARCLELRMRDSGSIGQRQKPFDSCRVCADMRPRCRCSVDGDGCASTVRVALRRHGAVGRCPRGGGAGFPFGLYRRGVPFAAQQEIDSVAGFDGNPLIDGLSSLASSVSIFVSPDEGGGLTKKGRDGNSRAVSKGGFPSLIIVNGFALLFFFWPEKGNLRCRDGAVARFPSDARGLSLV